MFPIYPVNEASVAPHGGRMVCAIMRDGTRHIGILSGCSKGKLMLNGYPSSFPGSLYAAGSYSNNGIQKAKKISSKKKKRNSKNKARPSAKLSSFNKPPDELLNPYFPNNVGVFDSYGNGGYGNGGYGNGRAGYRDRYGYGYGAGLALDLALIAFLFLLI
ncbi:hypothetical protein AV545_13145 [Paenibacillus jamilae]|uniref:hypothetical protein n=1 Tax=Paenibacillus jamilae TaxID=114136 RepID=UPI0007ABA99B|nr:hypothetical protein [Paenibacillus jamilae]KZE74668.1 hypothetical protein AV545_13145 [Paenibacillus jamilae]